MLTTEQIARLEHHMAVLEKQLEALAGYTAQVAHARDLIAKRLAIHYQQQRADSGAPMH